MYFDILELCGLLNNVNKNIFVMICHLFIDIVNCLVYQYFTFKSEI